MGVISEVSLDLNLALTYPVGPIDHLSSPGHLESSFFSAREEHQDPANRCGSSFSNDFEASSSGSGLNLSTKPESLLHFFRERREAVLEGCLHPVLPMETEIALYDNFIS